MKNISFMITTAVVIFLSSSVTAAHMNKVQTATRLYGDCFTSRVMSMELPTRRAPILNLIEELDTWCYFWTLVWYREQYNEELEESPSVSAQFNRNRIQLRSVIKNQILTEALR